MVRPSVMVARRTVWALAAALAALVQISCTTSSGPHASVSPLSSPTPIAVNVADSKAADLRTRLDLLLGEHVIVVAKESGAAAGPQAEYTAYASLLITNGSALGDLMRSAFGETAGGQFDQLWSEQNGYLVEYTIGLVTHNQSKSNGAMSGLLNGFVPQFSQFITTMTQLPSDSMAQLATQQVLKTKAMIDDQVAQNYPRMYADLRTAYAQTSQFGDALAPRIAKEFPDKFPGNPSSQAVDLRVSMNNLLQEHLYLTTMATDAATGGRVAERGAAISAVAGNTDALGRMFSGLFDVSAGTAFDRVWAAKNTAMIGYALASSSTAKQSALSQLNDVFVTQFSSFVQDSTGLTSSALLSSIEAQVAATVTVIDDQRSKSAARLGTDDMSANAAMAVVADLIAGAVIVKLHARFSG
jgi:hypothetical protein